MNDLFTTHFFQHGDVICLLLTHLFESLDVLISPFHLVLEHGYVGLETLTNFALSLDLSLNSAQVLQLNEVWLETLSLILLGDLSAGATGLLLTRGVHMGNDFYSYFALFNFKK